MFKLFRWSPKDKELRIEEFGGKFYIQQYCKGADRWYYLTEYKDIKKVEFHSRGREEEFVKKFDILEEARKFSRGLEPIYHEIDPYNADDWDF